MRTEVICSATGLMLCALLSVSAAQNQYLTIRQPDGTTFQAIERGEEFLQFLETPEGFVVRQGKDGYYRYFNINTRGEFVATSLKVGIDSPTNLSIRPYNLPAVRQALIQKIEAFNTAAEANRQRYLQRQRGGFSGMSGKRTGSTIQSVQQQEVTLQVGVLLVEFNDVLHYTDANHPNGYSTSEFETMLFSDNQYLSPAVSPDGESVFGSLRDYFEFQSHGLLHVTGQVINPNTGGIPTWLNMGNSSTYSNNQYNLLRDAINAAIGQGWNANYDIIAMVLAQGPYAYNPIFYTGIAFFQSHYVASDFAAGFDYANWFGGYALKEREDLEWREPNQDAFTHIGLHCHEMFHVIGWGIYNVLNEGGLIWDHAGAGDWSSMSDGYRTGLLRKCDSPGDLDPVAKVVMEWATPTLVNGDLINKPIQYLQIDNNPVANFDFYQINDPNPGSTLQFFVENRQYSGFNSFLPEWWKPGGKGGLLVWWRNGQDRNLRRGDNDADVVLEGMPNVSSGDLGDPFPGSANNQTLSMITTPNTHNLSGDPTGIAITNISSSATTMTATLRKSYLASNSANATASNNSRKLARDANGVYHLVYETGGEIYYQQSADGGVSWNRFRLLSNGTGGGKTNPCIYVRDGNILVVWQKNTGSSHDITFHKSTDYGATWPTSNRIVIASAVGSSSPLPVIVSPSTNQLMVVYRTATNLSYQTSSNYGNTWSAVTAVPSSGTSGNSPTLAVTNTYYGGNVRTALVNAATGGNGAIFYRYYKSGPDSTGWASSLLKNLSIIVPGTYTGHKNPSLAPSGSSGSTYLHAAWETNSGPNGVIIHRKANSWVDWPNVYSVTYYFGQQLPSITGLVYDTAELLFQYNPQNIIYKMHYGGTYWGGPVSVGDGTKPSVSVGNTTAKYVWTYGTATPYEIKTSTETLSKTNGNPLKVAYHRSIAVIDTTTGNWLEVRLDKLAVKTKSGEELAIPFAAAKEDDNTLTPDNAFANLASSSITLPTDAESLFVRCQVNGQGLSSIKKRDNAINVEIALAPKNGAAFKLPVINTSAEGLPETVRTIGVAASNLAGKEISLRAQVSGLDNKSSLIASLGHIYEIVETPVGKTLSAVAENTTPQDYTLSAYPNPFSASGTSGNPSTQIHFAMKESGRAAVRVYNLNGQLIRELLDEHRAAGEYTLPWDGRDHRGVTAASGVYFIRFDTANDVKLSKVMLVR